MQIQNVIGNPISFDGYTIASPSGALGGAWNSLQDQNLASWDEADNSGSTRLTEFKTSGTTTMNVGNSLNLGSPFAPAAPSAFGEEIGQDLTFQYSVPGGGTRSGIVEYTGGRNNLVLTIDPLTGEAAIQNESPFFNVGIDAYTITSTSGKLLTGNSAWNSLQDQSLPSWDQADNSNANRITEFKTAGSTSLTGGGTVLDLGAPVAIGSGALDVGDFNFEFSLSTGQTMEGIVQFGPLPTANTTDGDYDKDGDVDGRDFLVWQRTLGSSAVPPGSGADGNGNGVVDSADLTVWKNHYGSLVAANSSNLSSVPEPSTLVVAFFGLCCLGTRTIPGKVRKGHGAA